MEKTALFSSLAPIWPHAWDCPGETLSGGLTDSCSPLKVVLISFSSMWRTDGCFWWPTLQSKSPLQSLFVWPIFKQPKQIPFSFMKLILSCCIFNLKCEHLSNEWVFCWQNKHHFWFGQKRTWSYCPCRFYFLLSLQWYSWQKCFNFSFAWLALETLLWLAGCKSLILSKSDSMWGNFDLFLHKGHKVSEHCSESPLLL